MQCAITANLEVIVRRSGTGQGMGSPPIAISPVLQSASFDTRPPKAPYRCPRAGSPCRLPPRDPLWVAPAGGIRLPLPPAGERRAPGITRSGLGCWSIVPKSGNRFLAMHDATTNKGAAAYWRADYLFGRREWLAQICRLFDGFESIARSHHHHAAFWGRGIKHPATGCDFRDFRPRSCPLKRQRVYKPGLSTATVSSCEDA